MRAQILLVAAIALGAGCSKGINSQPVGSAPNPNYGYPTLSAYPAATKAADNPELAAAYEDLQAAIGFCRGVHNFYESRVKASEGYKQSFGFAGGIFGMIGTLLAAAGTGGYFGGIASGLGGVASTTLGSVESGPLAPASYERHRVAVAQKMSAAAAELRQTTDPEDVYQVAATLAMNCWASASPAIAVDPK
ncbi:hypothetical protein [Stutzerimonas stutzeri]|jgi:hypothetical protein|uniref:hypothetical protein n=1 Tax=Stutzerimonas stutzeri TaxID=316 RepID=UPI0005EBD21E|nr:hypothetical protein [Stutzerimonas stutzeri]